MTAPRKAKTAITYLRVSSSRQGQSGLGLEAQREAVTSFAAGRQLAVLAEFVEIESGKKDDRPQLAAALAQAEQEGAVLLIAKLDRLARSVAVVSSLMEAKVDFLAVDMPEANKLMIHIFSAFAEHERELISARTKAALAAAKVRGVQLGVRSHASWPEKQLEAEAHATAIMSAAQDIIGAGGSLRQIAAGLNARSLSSPQGGRWHPGNTARLLSRLAALSARSPR